MNFFFKDKVGEIKFISSFLVNLINTAHFQASLYHLKQIFFCLIED